MPPLCNSPVTATPYHWCPAASCYPLGSHRNSIRNRLRDKVPSSDVMLLWHTSSHVPPACAGPRTLILVTSRGDHTGPRLLAGECNLDTVGVISIVLVIVVVDITTIIYSPGNCQKRCRQNCGRPVTWRLLVEYIRMCWQDDNCLNRQTNNRTHCISVTTYHSLTIRVQDSLLIDK